MAYIAQRFLEESGHVKCTTLYLTANLDKSPIKLSSDLWPLKS